jgi:hypothetical protein
MSQFMDKSSPAPPVDYPGLRLAGWAAVLLALPTLGIAAFATGFDRIELFVVAAPLWLITGLIWSVASLIYGVSGRPIPTQETLFAPSVFVFVAAMTFAFMYLPSYIAPTATMNIRAVPNGTTVAVDGRTDVPDGARVRVSARHTDMILLDETVEVPVVDGAFSATLELERWPNGSVLVVGTFAVDERQPPAVIEKFGPNGEGLRGPGVVEDSDGFLYLNASTHLALVDGLESDDPRALKQPAAIVGIIQDASGVGIAHATVACSPEGAPPTTDEQPSAGGGFYCVLQPGRDTITASADGFITQAIVVDLEAGADRLMNLTLEPVR